MKRHIICLALTVVIAATLLVFQSPSATAGSVRDFGAKGDGKTNDTEAFKAAFASGDRDIFVPPGCYLIGPESLQLGEETYLHGAGRASALRTADGSAELLKLSRGVRVERLHIDGRGAKQGGVNGGLFVLRADAQQVTFDSISFADCDRACIYTDHGHDLTVRDCDFRNVGLGSDQSTGEFAVQPRN